MKQLSPIDSIFVYNELRNCPLHISPITFYDPSTAPSGQVAFENVLATFQSRLSLSPVFRRKLARVPFDLDSPYWVEDEDFDLEFHVRQLALPKPGDWRQFCLLLSRLHSRPLDMTRPPWEAYVIEGLDNIDGLPRGSFAMYMKIHHSAIDGATGNQIIQALHDLEPNPDFSVRRDDWVGEKCPSQLQLLGKSYANFIRQPSRVFRLVKHTLTSKSIPDEQKAMMRDHAVREPTRFNDDISPHRVFGAVPFKLDDIKAVKNAVEGCTLNDVVLAIVSGAMRRYLKSKKELPESSLVSMVPISVRKKDQNNTEGGNAVSGMRISLCSDITDPLERLLAIREDTKASKAYANAVGAERLVNVAESIPSSIAALGMRVVAGAGLSARNPVAHTVVTNVPGPQVPIYMCGAKSLLWLGAGCLMDGMGLFHTVNSYAGYIAIAFISDRDIMGDPAFYEKCILESATELQEAVAAPKKARPVKARPKRLKSA